MLSYIEQGYAVLCYVLFCSVLPMMSFLPCYAMWCCFAVSCYAARLVCYTCIVNFKSHYTFHLVNSYCLCLRLQRKANWKSCQEKGLAGYHPSSCGYTHL